MTLFGEHKKICRWKYYVFEKISSGPVDWRKKNLEGELFYRIFSQNFLGIRQEFSKKNQTWIFQKSEQFPIFSEIGIFSIIVQEILKSENLNFRVSFFNINQRMQ